MMHGPEKSDPAIVAGKPTNKAERSAAELVEPRAGTKGNAYQQSMHWTRARFACHRRWSAYGKHLPSYTRGGSRMRASRTYGSVRGARGNSRPYREEFCCGALWSLMALNRRADRPPSCPVSGVFLPRQPVTGGAEDDP